MDDELLGAFIAESREHLATIETDLLAIEEGGASADLELINQVFRAAHSIKGASGFFGFESMKELAHKAETVLDMLRSRRMVIDAEITNLLLAAFDALRTMIGDPARAAEQDVSPLSASLTTLAASYLPRDARPSLTDSIALSPEDGCGPSVLLNRADYEAALSAKKTVYAIEYDLIHDIQRRGKNVLDIFHLLWESGEVLECAVNFDAVGTLDDGFDNQLPLRLVYATILDPINIDLLFPSNRQKVKVLRENCQSPETPAGRAEIPPRPSERSSIEPSAPVDPAEMAAPVSSVSTTVFEESIRVNVAVLERLMNLAEELVLGRSQLRAAIAQKNPRGLLAADQRMNQITTELQDVIMRTRLQPIGNVFGKFPRDRQ